ncbi:gene transfer agent family protein [Sphingopyxis indica]|uniref:Phage tail tube protein, GTA-gp10 n=2 Tax=Sphingopyxis indica TaxID=436663 RepID=A0A239JKT2_9SPHN|nr:gene transfer agent family protein [Sphingopyxis indica]WOF43696.1 gene transfer agent family protein [Sphingopyxis indica]SNT06172.1 Phage tail tube protein, GTA-gp10 [Sphingopyxis indica]
MSAGANPLRGEAELRIGENMHVLRPSFAALVAAEEELGPLFALVERAAGGGLRLGELAALFWHCLRERPAGLTREAVGEAVVAQGLAAVTPALRMLLGQIVRGR